MISRNDPCWCGSALKWKKCCYPKISPATLKEQYKKKYRILLKTEEEIRKIRAVCTVTAKILDRLCSEAKAGVTTQELDDLSMELHKEFGAIPAPLGYGSPPYTKSICTSINEVICHGIPDNRKLEEGDILNIDVSCIIDGFYGDTSRMVLIGSVSEEKKHVCNVSKECLKKAISICKPGILISQIGDTIEEYAASQKCSVVNQFVGHGVGKEFHEPPDVPHNYNDIHIPLVPGMTFTIEPMINSGVREGVIDSTNHWTARTKDGKPSAQWEHTILITEKGHEILTL